MIKRPEPCIVRLVMSRRLKKREEDIRRRKNDCT